ncbi:MAG: UvrD-helicase domain-containing protein [Leptospiraceae bacterium]
MNDVARHLDPYEPEFLGSGKHRIIEASAGTGKTHFIEEQVLFWILHGAHLNGSSDLRVPEIHEVLVLTFTEKATGELKLRIRQRLARFVREGLASLSKVPEGADEATMQQRANLALKRFDSACIFTIHGFCNHIIRTTGLAGDADFRIEQNDLLRQEAITETIRKYLMDWFADQLPLALSISDFFDYRVGFSTDGFSFDDQLLNLLEHIREQGLPLDFSDSAKPAGQSEDLFPLFGAQTETQIHIPFVPDQELIPAEIQLRIQELKQRLLDLDENLLYGLSLLKPLYSDSWNAPEQLSKDSQLNKELLATRKQFNSRVRSASATWQESLWQLFRFLADSKHHSSEYFWPLLKSAGELTVQNMGSSEDPLWDGVESNLGEFLHELVKIWEAGRQQKAPVYERFLELCSLQVDRITGNWKKANRSLEFQDLLRFVDREVEHSSDLAALLRDRFPFAVIDEFQDTDPVQWSIFKNIYLVSAPGASITVVGDPKQSIYGFRGADISAYEMARKAITVDGLEGRLSISYRSHAPLLRVFDKLFSHSNWFGDLYHSVDAASDELRKWKWPDGVDTPPVEIHDLKDAGNQRLRMFETARLIAGDINLLAGKFQLLEGRNESEIKRNLQYEDMAILVSRNKDARLIEKVLRERSIPCSIYKESGLYTSVPAYEFLVLLHSLQDLHRHYNQLRLTSFFPAPLVSVASLPEPGLDHPVVQILDQLRELALPGKWPQFFRNLLDSTFVLQKRESNHLYESRISVTLQLLEEFSEYAIGYGSSLEELIQYVQRAAYGADIQQDLMRRKREKPGVSIMTIHASKGLQFPVVFSALQFTSRGGFPEILRYQDSGGMKLSLSHDEQRRERHRLESLGEDRRLAYVAFTRAALKLFIYFVSDAKGIHPLQKEVLGPVMSDLSESGIAELIRFRNAPSSGSSPSQDIEESSQEEELFNFHSPDLQLSFHRSGIHSFSSLLSRITAPLEVRSLQEKLEEMLGATRLEEEIIESDSPDSGQASLPAGIDFGLMVHSILEDLDFQDILEGQIQPAISSRANQYFPDRARDPAFLLAMEQMLRNTLTTVLPGAGVSLSSVPSRDLLAEMEFFITANPAELASWAGVDLSELNEVYLRGFVDLIFRVDNCYYLLDWKTNSLEAYDNEHLSREMKHHRYDIQARIYFQALARWLAITIPDFNPELHLGGAYYLFVRGMKNGSQEGIYYLSPEQLHV